MFGISNLTRVYICTGATDGRLGYEGLKALTVKKIQQDPMCGHLMIFCNAARNRIKIFWWDGTGFYIAAKRMRRGGFDFPKDGGAVAKMSLAQLDALLKGVDFVRRPPNR